MSHVILQNQLNFLHLSQKDLTQDLEQGKLLLVD